MKSSDATRPSPRVYPFAALVGQEEMKLALLLAGVDPSLGGVLVLGQRGTAKSTAARGLANLWPGQGRFVTLPLGATEDRVVGSLDFEAALTQGRVKAEPGLLVQAHHGVLYIDEVNLLEEHLASLILDAAVSGWVRIEREGVSECYPARFTLIGTMNPEEGQVSPQLLDRFGLAVRVKAEESAGLRQELIRRRLAFEAAPERFLAQWAPAEAELAGRLAQARAALERVQVPSRLINLAAKWASQAGAAGQRAELCLSKAGRALAAWEGRGEVDLMDLRRVAELALTHRRRQVGPVLREGRQEKDKPQSSQAEAGRQPRPDREPAQTAERRTGQRADGAEAGLEHLYGVNIPYQVATQDSSRNGGWLRDSGRRLKRETETGSGRYVRASMERLGREIALDATFRAAAPHQARRTSATLRLVVASADIREKVKVKSTGRLVIFVVDGSGSMGAVLRMQEAKAAVLSLLAEAYQKRDRVGLITFRGDAAQVLLPPTNSVELAKRGLEALPTGGKTPLLHGLVAAGQAVAGELRRDPKLNPLIIILTDGKPNIPWTPGAEPWDELLTMAGRLRRPGLNWLVVDSDQGHYLSVGCCRQLAERLKAPYVQLDELRSQGLVRLVQDTLPR